ncbi:MAG TPA: sigma-70 family RNA polymerase sigma factor [Ghiorsea sp.]|nr:sigma-70 family RNA polymerase sigma factor [Ghiorsea sp.]HIP07784.1 sigma-70 family RNA polymerase sigma factor [Mariprofundaceae bacterium]
MTNKREMNPEQWLSEYGDMLYRFALQRAQDSELAADLVQETLLSAWKSKDSFAGNSTVRTWLVGILKHKWIDHLRKEIRTREQAQLAEGDPTAWFDVDSGKWNHKPEQWHDDPASLCQNKQFMQVLQGCTENLPSKQQRVFAMRELQGLDSEEICKACDISSTNLHVLLHRARLGLRHCLNEHWFGGQK